ncbi:MAG: ADP-forming succinate--CoA ligase subunit beta [Acidiferrobacter sp.]
MRLHEYQAKALFAQYGLSTPVGVVVKKGDDVAAAMAPLRGPSCVVKAQIHAGARGKAGGVQVVARAAAPDLAKRLLGSRLVTTQTGPGGQPVNALLIEEPVAAVSELYLACVLDRRLGKRVILASAEGGVGIEEGRPPIHLPIETLRGFSPYQGRGLAKALGLSGRLVSAFGDIVAALVDLACETDAVLVEINPLMVTADGSLVAADGKIEIDDNALFRQARLDRERDPDQSDPKDEEARAQGLQYIALDGDIGCLVNGAGLAMATMDLIALAGGRPANFLDVGGGTTAEKVGEALTLLVSDPKVKTVLVNIFGGIVRCDLIAEGLLLAAADFGRALPIVVRLVGTRREEGRLALAQSGLAVDVTDSLEEAARLAVTRARAS